MIGKILVAGANGSVGSEIVNQLIRLNQPVKAAVRDLAKAKTQNWDSKWVEIAQFEYTNVLTWKKAFQGVDRMVVIVPPGDPNAYDIVSPSLEHAKEIGIQKFVLISAMGVDASEEIPLRKLEIFLERGEVPYVILRCNWFMQNFMKMFEVNIRDQNVIRAPAGDGKVGFIDCRDIAEVAGECVISNERDDNIYTLTGSEALSYEDVAAIFAKVLGREITYVALSEEEAREEFSLMGLPPENVTMYLSLYNSIRMGWSARLTMDVPEILERDPILFEQFVDDFSRHWLTVEPTLEF